MIYWNAAAALRLWMANHENRTASRVGLVCAAIRDHALHVDGEILSTSGTAAGIVEQAAAGGDWQLSIGAEVLEAVRVGPRQSIAVNGRALAGPLVHVRRAVLREVSVIPVGADGETRMSIAAAWRLTRRATAGKWSAPPLRRACCRESLKPSGAVCC